MTDPSHKQPITCGPLCQPHKIAPGTQPNLFTQVRDFFTHLVNTSDWPARWHCGNWSDFHGWLYIISDIAIWAAYFAIPVLLFRIVYKRKDMPFSSVFWLFIAFITLCGTTHLLDAIIFWWPAYRLSALVRLATAVVSIFTVFALYKILPLIYKLRTLEQLQAEIEERKKAEQEARNQQIAAQAATELVAKKDEFISIASHELKTPITSLKASLQFLQRITDNNEHLQEVTPFTSRALKQVDKLTGIIQDLFDVTRIQAGKLELVKTDFNLMELVNECVEECETDNTGHSIQINGDPNITINADKNRLDQVLCNFLTNSFKYSAVNTPIKILVEKLDDGSAKVSVTDEGIGISPDKLELIFDRFYQIGDAHRRMGVGLGLYISSEIISRHNGKIGVNSVLGQGSTFWFII